MDHSYKNMYVGAYFVCESCVFMSVYVKLTRRHPLVCGRLFFSVDLFPLKVVISSLAVATRPKRLLEAAIACDRREGELILL